MQISLLNINGEPKNEYCSYRRPGLSSQHASWPAHRHLLQGVSCPLLASIGKYTHVHIPHIDMYAQTYLKLKSLKQHSCGEIEYLYRK